jgi:outer membrane protein assembly factor BamB
MILLSTRRAQEAVALMVMLLGVAALAVVPLVRAAEESGFFITLQSGDRLICCGVVALSTGDYMLVGRADSVRGPSIPWAARVTRAGRVEWERQLPFSSTATSATSITGGVRGEGDAIYGFGSQGRLPVIIRLGLDGGLMWSKTLPQHQNARATAVAVTRDGKLVVGGITHTGSGPLLKERLFASGITALGDVLWRTDLAEDSEAFVVRELQTGDYIVGASSNIARLSSHGRVLWSKHVVGLFGIVELADGALVFGEWLLGSPSGGIHLSSIGPTGDARWRKTIAEPKWCTALALWKSADGSIVASGDLCDAAEQLWVATFSSGGQRLAVRHLMTRPGTAAFRIQPGPGRQIAAAGVFRDDSPDAGKGWAYLSPP